MGTGKRTLVVVAFTALVSCSGQALPAATPTTPVTTLRLYATTAAAPLLNDLTASYARTHPGIRFETAVINYAALVERLASGEEFYFLSSHLLEESPLWAAPIGQDAVAVIVHPDITIAGVTTEQLRSIYQGRMTHWRALRGPDEAIVVFTREDGSGTRAEFERLVMGDRRTTQSAHIAPSSSAMVTSVARTPGGVGYVSMSYLDGSVRPLAINGVAPTAENVTGHTYPLRSTLFVVGVAEPQSEEYRAFIAWIQSQEGQAVVAWDYAPLLQP